MRRIIIIGVAIAVLGSAAAAWASSSDPNTYGGSISVSPAKAGKPKRPVIDGWTQNIAVSSNQTNKTAAPLTDIKTWIYGLTVNTKLEPTCSSSKIENSLGTGCPGKSLVASGTVQSTLGASSRNPNQSEPCDVNLRVFNGGKNYVWFFFISPSLAQCPAPTGSAHPYKGTFSRSHGNLVLNVPLPPDVSIMAGGLPNTYASLDNEHLVWKKITKRVKGKKVGYFSSVGCKAGKRPWKVTYTDTTNASNSFSTTKSGKLTC